MKKILKFSLYTISIICIIGLCFTLFLYNEAKLNPIDIENLKKPRESVEIFYADNSKMEFAINSEYLTLDKIPKYAINALIAIEDKRFYTHGGIDYKGILRAFKNNLFSGKLKEGGSTITQQLAKNAYLSGEKTLGRKFKEITFAYQLENKLSKDEILEKYLNTVYFGENAYGISCAAKKFFGKSAGELNLSECATLIACLKAPTYYNPKKNLQKSIERRNLILNEMLKQGYVDKNAVEIAKNTDIILNFSNNYECDNVLYDEILTQVFENCGLKSNELNGLKIYTAIDKSLMQNLPSSRELGLDCDFSILITDNITHQTIAFKSTVGNVKRTPASTVKPFLIYAPAIEENYVCPATKIMDEKTDFDGFSPSNYNDKYYGYVNVKNALAKSLNVPSVKVCNVLGLEKIRNYAQKMGISYQNNDLSIALGNLVGGVTLTELSDAYSVFTNNGNYSKSSLIERILNENGKTIYENEIKSKKVFDEATAFLINDCLNYCAKTGTANKLSNLKFTVYAKTGTAGNKCGNTDAYCVAYTTRHTVAVWLGNANGELMSNSVSGGNYPTDMAKTALINLYKNYTPEKFAPPSSVVEVGIDKDAYEKDCKIIKTLDSENNQLKFWFKHDFKIENAPTVQNLPVIKSYKIDCNNREISIIVNCDNEVYYYIEDDLNNVVFDSKSQENFVYTTPKYGEYNFSLTPYKIENGKIILGKQIKLPTVKTEGNKKILDSNWWCD